MCGARAGRGCVDCVHACAAKPSKDTHNNAHKGHTIRRLRLCVAAPHLTPPFSKVAQSAMPSGVSPWLTFTTGKKVIIEDTRLGILLWVLRALLLWFYLNDLINHHGYLDVTDVASAKANFWANVGDLYTVQQMGGQGHTPWRNYCDGQYWAIPSECKASSSNGDTCFTGKLPGKYSNCDGIFCELDWQCVANDFSQLNIKGEQMMSFVTTNKDYKKTIANCTVITKAECDARGEVYQISANGYQCACIKMENQFMVGAEAMTLNFQHMFTPSAASGVRPEIEGKRICDASEVQMTLWKENNEGGMTKVKQFDLGVPAKYKVSDWLKMVGGKEYRLRAYICSYDSV